LTRDHERRMEAFSAASGSCLPSGSSCASDAHQRPSSCSPASEESEKKHLYSTSTRFTVFGTVRKLPFFMRSPMPPPVMNSSMRPLLEVPASSRSVDSASPARRCDRTFSKSFAMAPRACQIPNAHTRSQCESARLLESHGGHGHSLAGTAGVPPGARALSHDAPLHPRGFGMLKTSGRGSDLPSELAARMPGGPGATCQSLPEHLGVAVWRSVRQTSLPCTCTRARGLRGSQGGPKGAVTSYPMPIPKGGSF
jgi:hypothetical protein